MLRFRNKRRRALNGIHSDFVPTMRMELFTLFDIMRFLFLRRSHEKWVTRHFYDMLYLAYSKRILLSISRKTINSQLCAHLAALGYSIIGDQVYAPAAKNGTPEVALTRQFLHAHSLQLRRYPDNASCTFVAPLADELVLWLESYFPLLKTSVISEAG